ncbi:MAG: tetratricopeptide repeat protein [Pyrinomonadaceae bacterium]
MKRRMHNILFWVHVNVLAALVVLAVYGLAHGRPAMPQQLASVPASNARMDELRRAGVLALYNLDYEGAQKQFAEIARLYPEHPAGPQLLATGLWLKTLNSSRRLQSGLYNTESFYKESEEKTDPKAVAQFRELTRTARTLAEARLKKNPKDVEALYYLGSTQGLRAAFAAAVERSFMSALRAGSDAVDKHREVLKLDPNFHDAELSIGMYEYVAGSLPPLVKVIATFTGTRGSKKKGLAMLERVVTEGQWSNDEARVVLMTLYKREKRYADALKYARELAAKYPRNYLFKLETADALVSQAASERRAGNAAATANYEREAFAMFDALLRERAARQLDQIHFQYGEALFVAGQHERAAKEFLAAATVANAEKNLATFARLRAAQSLDLAGKRSDALAQYKLVLESPNVYDSHEEAKRGLKEPFKKTDGKAKVEESGGAEAASNVGDEK